MRALPFTASVTSTLTAGKLQGLVTSASDLSSVRVGAVQGSATEEYLTGRRIAYRRFPSPQDGLTAIRNGDLDAFVYDKPLLAWIIREQFASSAALLDVSFDQQMYGIALPLGSQLRKPIDLAILETVQSESWRQILFSYLGGP